MSEFKPVENPAFTFTLSTPIKFLSEEIGEIAVRAPTGKDMLEVGNPIKFDLRYDPPTLDIDMPVAYKMLARLTGLPPIAIESMEPGDSMGCFWGFAPFFVPRR